MEYRVLFNSNRIQIDDFIHVLIEASSDSGETTYLFGCDSGTLDVIDNSINRYIPKGSWKREGF